MQTPRPESRLSALESLTSLHTAHIKELAADTDENFRSLREDISQLSDKVDLGFRQAHVYVDEHVSALKEDIAALKMTQDTQGQKLDLILQLLQTKGQ